VTPQPLRFGEPGRELFGILHAPPDPAPASHAVLLCNPFGNEAIRWHRVLRVVAERLAASGATVMRFDYLGTGDSDGDEQDGTLGQWSADVERASRQLAARSRCRSMTWLGLRLGGTLALRAFATAASSPQQIVVLDPVLDGSVYLDELARAEAGLFVATHPDFPPPPIAGTAGTTFLGFPVPARLESELRALKPLDLTWPKQGATMIATGAYPAVLVADAESRGARVVRVEEQVPWSAHDAYNSPAVPAAALRAVVECSGAAP
jgi:pimeloyl-ACP methyl ester carboxylesterase